VRKRKQENDPRGNEHDNTNKRKSNEDNKTKRRTRKRENENKKTKRKQRRTCPPLPPRLLALGRRDRGPPTVESFAPGNTINSIYLKPCTNDSARFSSVFLVFGKHETPWHRLTTPRRRLTPPRWNYIIVFLECTFADRNFFHGAVYFHVFYFK
jgi:hypothetical protein